MSRSKARQTCREYRAIPYGDLPTVTDMETKEARPATDNELLNMGIVVFDRGSSNVQAICNGYWCPDRKCGINLAGDPWPGTLIAGSRGMYRTQREPLIEQNLVTYKGGSNGGRTRLMDTPLPQESERTDTDGKVIPAQPLTDSERLAKRLPRIQGDG